MCGDFFLSYCFQRLIFKSKRRETKNDCGSTKLEDETGKEAVAIQEDMEEERKRKKVVSLPEDIRRKEEGKERGKVRGK